MTLAANDHEHPPTEDIVQFLGTLSPVELEVTLAATMGLLDHAKGYGMLLRSVDNILRKLQSNNHRIETVAHLVGWKHGVTIEQMRSPSRDQDLVKARDEAWWTLRQIPGLSLQRIGRWFGNRDHSTIVQGVHRHTLRLTDAS